MDEYTTAIFLSLVIGLVHSSGVHEFQPVAPVGSAPVVTAASSQYFHRTFNRLVAVPQVLEPVPITPVPVPVAPAPPIVVEDARTTPIAPTNPPQPQNAPVNPNVAIAVATAHAAAPVATILLPPYPFGVPFGFFPRPADNFPTDNPNREATTQNPATKAMTTPREPESTTGLPSNVDNSFAQALPSNENANFRQYFAPNLPQQTPQQSKPQKLKTTVEVVPVPLTYIAPPAQDLHHHHHHHHHSHHHSLALKAVPHIHTFIPKTKIIIRPVSPHRIVRVPVSYRMSKRMRNGSRKYVQNQRSNPRDIEPTTFRPINRPFTKPPRL